MPKHLPGHIHQRKSPLNRYPEKAILRRELPHLQPTVRLRQRVDHPEGDFSVPAMVRVLRLELPKVSSQVRWQLLQLPVVTEMAQLRDIPCSEPDSQDSVDQQDPEQPVNRDQLDHPQRLVGQSLRHLMQQLTDRHQRDLERVQALFHSERVFPDTPVMDQVPPGHCPDLVLHSLTVSVFPVDCLAVVVGAATMMQNNPIYSDEGVDIFAFQM